MLIDKSKYELNLDRFIKLSEGATYSNVSPVIQKQIGIDHMSNISISGKFRTDYNGENIINQQGISFIQIAKNNTGKASCFSGFGIAWKPLSINNEVSSITIDSVLKRGTNQYQLNISRSVSSGIKALYLKKNNSYYPFYFEEVVAGVIECNISVVPTENDKIYETKPNIFLVDCDDFTELQYTDTDDIGIEYIDSAFCIIKANTDYYFKMIITESKAISFYISDVKAHIDTNSPSITYKVIGKGSISNINSFNSEKEKYTSFGISVFNCNGNVWYYDDIKISSLDKTYMSMYAVMDVSQLSNMITLSLTGYGFGVTSSGSQEYGIIAKAYNRDRMAWDILIDNTNNSSTPLFSKSFDKSNYIQNGFIDILIHSKYPSSIDYNSLLVMDNIEILSTEPIGSHIGGFIDIYIDDTNAEYKSVTIGSLDNGNYLQIGKSHHIDGINNIVGLNSLYDGTKKLVYGTDYIVSVNDSSLLNSNKSTLTFAFENSPDNLIINYYDSACIDDIQDHVCCEYEKLYGKNVLVIHKTIKEVQVNVTGSQNDLIVKDLVLTYIKSLNFVNEEKKISYSSIINHLVSSGITEVGVLTVSITYFDGKFNYSVLETDGDYEIIKRNQTIRTV